MNAAAPVAVSADKHNRIFFILKLHGHVAQLGADVIDFCCWADGLLFQLVQLEYDKMIRSRFQADVSKEMAPGFVLSALQKIYIAY